MKKQNKTNMNFKTKKIFLNLITVTILTSFIMLFSMCTKDETPVSYVTISDTVLKDEINENKTLTANKTYYLDGVVYIVNGATLTIEPGDAKCVIFTNYRNCVTGCPIFTWNTAASSRDTRLWRQWTSTAGP